MPEISKEEWQDFVSGCSNVHILQSPQWGEFKGAFDWQVTHICKGDVGAQILFRRLPFGLSFAYIPKGPVTTSVEGAEKLVGESGYNDVLKKWDHLWFEVDEVCKSREVVFLKVEPDLWIDDDFPIEQVLPKGFRVSTHNIQPPRTLVVDLNTSEEQILGHMKQKTRYNIRLSLRKGVIVRPSNDIETFHQMMQTTAQRVDFEIHSFDYFRQVYERFHPYGMCELLIAEYQDEPLAGLMVFSNGKRAWYFYGASRDVQRNRMPTYTLQWEAMKWARSQGCEEYDLWGVPDADHKILEAQFTKRRDGLWGVYRFKRGFGGELRRSLGPWDRIYKPFFYTFYRWLVR
ncbi:MAG: peptidoglycan bridge formation glycyltransferase FemA/FemB family protein [Anaerolineales bacterium]|jgi:lipid II:glycine glycyltransferase (peptidoglycan interpeptide bridge formation enzyme)